MKKILLVLFLFSVVLLPALVFAQQGGPQECCRLRRAITLEGVPCAQNTVVGPTGATCQLGGVPNTPITCATPSWGMMCLMNTVNQIVDWVFIVMIFIIVAFVLAGGLSILTSGGDPEKVNSGKNYLLYAVIGTAVAVLARAVPAIITLIVGL